MRLKNLTDAALKELYARAKEYEAREAEALIHHSGNKRNGRRAGKDLNISEIKSELARRKL